MRADVVDVLADAATAVADGVNVTDAVEWVLAGITSALGVDAAAVLVEARGRLDLLASTSHQVADLEIYQLQMSEGPCLTAIEARAEMHVSGADALVERWPAVGRAIVEAGYTSVHAVPLVWRGHCYGALNSFGSKAGVAATTPEAGRILAGAVTLVVAGSILGPGAISEGLGVALAERAAVEQAKGALAQVRGVSVADAFDVLVEIARAEGTGVGSAAHQVLERARAGTLR